MLVAQRDNVVAVRDLETPSWLRGAGTAHLRQAYRELRYAGFLVIEGD